MLHGSAMNFEADTYNLKNQLRVKTLLDITVYSACVCQFCIHCYCYKMLIRIYYKQNVNSLQGT